jgi:transposase
MVAMAHSLDVRQKVMAAIDEGRGSQEEVAAIFGVSSRWIRRLIVLRQETGSLALSRAPRGPKPKIAGPLESKLERLVANKPDATLAQFRRRLGVDTSLTTVWRALRRLDHTVKKKV